MKLRNLKRFSLGIVLAGIGILPAFQNCAKVSFSVPQELASQANVGSNGDPAPNPNPNTNINELAASLKDQIIVTQINTPVEFTAVLKTDDGKNKRLVFPNGKSTLATVNGLLEILDDLQLKLRYTPNSGFRGNDVAVIYLKDSKDQLSQALLTAQVGNALNSVRPALASRATGCIMCHSNITSTVITDFGYGGDGKGLNYFFGGVPGVLPSGFTNTQGGSAYGDYDFSTSPNVNWGNSTITGPNVIVPVAPTTGLRIAKPSLATYLSDALSRNLVAVTRNVPVVEVPSVFIGAPTAERIKQVSGLVSPNRFKFVPESANSPPLSGLGLSADGKYFTNTASTVICNGDVVIDGVLWLKNASIQTELGCRFYITQSAFISGPLLLPSTNAKRNVQITAAHMVALGLGRGCSGGDDSIQIRLINEERKAGFFTRNLGTPSQLMTTLLADAGSVAGLKDATCEPAGRMVSFERLLVNAPVVESRYKGAFRGSIIAEITLTSLASLEFSFDPVLSEVPILPLLLPKDYLTIQF